ncbi:MAG: hypothetical protein QF441_03380 [Bacteriovoracaceae bacterium]|jgi:hypothetical protein|nr:hypothetical protein [Halobacteriovoraceae bacterium]MDP7319619.1 hypothetical protein [Bacteriovoracaceae bacterium]
MREKNKKKLISIFIISLFFSMGVHASLKPIACETNFGEKSFTIQGETVAFHDTQKIKGRSISSILDSKTRNSHKGFNKTVYQDGYKHLIHIENKNSFNSTDDFLAITSPKGHKMTFPINCNQLD